MIKFILNGSFRSGTTLLWKIMRESNPTMHVFCEPLHNDLFYSIHVEQVLQQYSHGYSTTSEYLEQGEKFLTRLRQFHPLIGKAVYTHKVSEVIEYLKIFDSLDKPVILQPNRMHFIISNVADTFGCTVAHIIRHPLDVFLSLMFSSPKLKAFRSFTGMNPYLFRLIRNPNQYFLDEQCDFVSDYFGLGRSPHLPYKYFRPKVYYLQRFILCWTLSNWYAVHEIDNVKGLIVRYEDIVSSEDTLQTLEKYSGIRFDPKKVKINKSYVKKYKKSDESLCFALAIKAGVGDKYRYLLERFNYDL